MDLALELRDATALSAVVFVLALLLGRIDRPSRPGRSRHKVERRHARYRRSAAKARVAIGAMEPMENPARVFGYIRSLPPYVFEEMIISEIAARGHGVQRSPSYSGDFGIDGFCEIGGRRWFVQAKRYRRWVRPADVAAFAAICEAKGARGLFVHTGRTGPLSKAAENASPFVRVVSGLDLVRLFAGEPIPLLRPPARAATGP